MKLIRILENKFVIFCIQFSILSLLLFLFQYQFNIRFDSTISNEQRQIIQFLANYVLYNGWSGLLLIYSIWLLVSLIPIFIYRNFRKVYSLNLLTFFLPNFFFYVFLFRYSREYFNLEFPNLITKTIILCIVIELFSIGLALIVAKLFKKDSNITEEDFEIIQKETTITCPNCGTHFKSVPKYCYKCNTKLDIDNSE
ncbi:MAG: hypothetical protein ACFFBH_06915 [Promethearchaeota archaeon]